MGLYIWTKISLSNPLIKAILIGIAYSAIRMKQTLTSCNYPSSAFENKHQAGKLLNNQHQLLLSILSKLEYWIY